MEPEGRSGQRRPKCGRIPKKKKAEREGFEPSKELPLYAISSRVPSATRTPLREWSKV